MVVSQSFLHATPLYWDLNGTAANTGTTATGAWNGTNAFWNSEFSGTGGSVQAISTNTDDLFFSSGTGYTSGAVTVTGAVSANSITFEEGSINLSGGTSLTLGGGGGSTPGLVFASGTGTNNISTALILGSNSNFTQNSSTAKTIGAITGAAGGFGLTVDGSGSGIVTISGVIGTNVNGVTLNNPNGTLILTGNSSTTTLNGNTYTGNTTLTAGTLQGRNLTTSVTDVFNAFGTSNLQLNGGTLQLTANGGGASGRTIVGTNAVTIGNSAVAINVNRNSGTYNTNSIGFSGNLSIGSGQVNVTGANGYFLRFSGITTLTGNATLNPTTANLTIVGAIGDGGSGYSLTKDGAGTLTLGAANTYSGGTTINQGIVTLANTTSNLGTGAVALNNSNTTGAGTSVVLNALTGNPTTIGSLSGTISTPTSGTNTVTINTGTAQNFFVKQTTTGTYQGVIAGGGAFVTDANSTHALTLAGNNTYSFGTFVNGGTLIAGVGDTSTTVGAFGGSSRAINLGSTSGSINANLLIGGAFTIGNAITVRTGSTGNTLALGGSTATASIFSGAINLGTNIAGPSKDVTLVAATNGSVEFQGIINESASNTGVSNVTIGNGSNLGTVKLGNAANAYGGITTLDGGTLEVARLADGAGTSSIGNSSNVASNLAINGGTLKFTGTTGNGSTNRLFTIGTNGATLDGSSSDNTALTFTNAGSLATTTGATDRTLTLTGTTTGATLNSIASVIVDPTGGGKTLLTKNGANTWVLNGANTYTGATTINDGTLALGASGSISNTSGVSLGTGGTFDVSAKGGYTVNNLTGSGDVIGSLTVSTQLAIGNSPGTTTFDELTLGAASGYIYELTGGSSPGAGSADLGIVSGDLTLVSGAVLDLVQLGSYTVGNKFTLFAYTGTLSGIFKDTGAVDLADGATFTDALGLWTIDYNDTTAGLNGGTTSGASYVTLTAVPESRAALLGGLGLLALLRRRR